MSITVNAQQEPCEVAVVIPTLLRPSLLRAARSVFAQELDGRIHLLVGVDVAQGDPGLLDVLRTECPDHVMLTILDLGYSTSQRHGGQYPNHFSGALRSILTYQANSRYVAYLDDSDWYARHHLASLRTAMGDRQWAFSHRWLLDPATLWPICRDEWDAVGPDRGINKKDFGGFVHPSCLMLDKHAFHFGLPLWSMALFPDGGGEDRLIFNSLKESHTWGESSEYTAFCPLNAESVTHRHHTEQFDERDIGWVGNEAAIQELKASLERASSALQRHDPLIAERNCRRALQINRYHPVALELLAQALRNRGDLAGAIAQLAQAIEIDETDDRLADYASLLIEARKTDRAAEILLDNRRLLHRSAMMQSLFGALPEERATA